MIPFAWPKEIDLTNHTHISKTLTSWMPSRIGPVDSVLYWLYLPPTSYKCFRFRLKRFMQENMDPNTYWNILEQHWYANRVH